MASPELEAEAQVIQRREQNKTLQDDAQDELPFNLEPGQAPYFPQIRMSMRQGNTKAGVNPQDENEKGNARPKRNLSDCKRSDKSSVSNDLCVQSQLVALSQLQPLSESPCQEKISARQQAE
jgi:hypothetical protein